MITIKQALFIIVIYLGLMFIFSFLRILKRKGTIGGLPPEKVRTSEKVVAVLTNVKEENENGKGKRFIQ